MSVRECAMNIFCGGCATTINPPRFCSQCGSPITLSESETPLMPAGSELDARLLKSGNSGTDRVKPEFVSLRDAAFTLSVSVKTVRQWIAAGDLRAYRRGKRIIRVRAEDLELLMKPIPSARYWPE